MNTTIATIWSDGLDLAVPRRRDDLALAEATMRRPETMNSRVMMTIAIHAGRLASSTSASSAAVTSSLSASGSMNLPNVVTSLRERAR